MNKEIPKAYNPALVESKWYQFWLEKGYFTPKIDSSKTPFTIIMPPPNVTGQLHVGHALTAALEDTMVRWRRMNGQPALWLPGTDHAGIATQVVVEQMLAKEGTTRQALGREKFVARVWEWVRKYGGIISEQHRRLGASCDWPRERFTLDEGPSRAVRATFVNLYNKGLIYRGERIINWCPRCATALSDLEVEHKEVEGNLWHINYPLAGEPGFITVATTRPETILGDTGVAVNPCDCRYENMRDKKVVLPVIGRTIPIVADEIVDQSFGTGAVKVTPAHDPVDFDIAQRQKLPLVNILNPDGTMNENAGPYQGMDRFACRKAILRDLEEQGLLIKVDKHVHQVGHCDRCHTPVEPWASKQWFVTMAGLAAPAIEAVRSGEITILPERFAKVYLNWMENIRDWCISRQLWWGHRIPVWYCPRCGQITVSVDEPKVCSHAHCRSADIYQDPDVLDTWFSSALWPHSTLGWPEQTQDLRYFYPTSVMETGYDILFFWVARMIMMGIENTGKVPFKTVYLHGLIRDEAGEKMSKLRGNVINPLDAIEKYGTDALRFALTTGSSPGNDIRMSWQKLEASRNFCNKLWNAARYVESSIPADFRLPDRVEAVHVEDRWVLSRFNRLITDVDRLLKEYQFGEAERQIHEFVWGDYCDWYIELSKIRLRSGSGETDTRPVLLYVLEKSIRLLHPFMPFITEELWQGLRPHLNATADSVMISPYPQPDAFPADGPAEAEMSSVIEIVRAIRNARAEAKVEPVRWIEAQVFAREDEKKLAGHREAIETLARVRPLQISGSLKEKPAGTEAVVLVLAGADVVLPLRGMIDVAAETAKLEKEISQEEAEKQRLETKLGNMAFVSRAPAGIVARDRQRLGETEGKLGRLKERLARLAG
ncbi:MAG: valine--tRNA ligase [Chloroflexi bacterium]|nr:valine--tRNA ligase [Chloroflexota bacterium]